MAKETKSGQISVPASMTPAEARDIVKTIEKTISVTSGRGYAAIGDVLVYMKGKLPHGEFGPWCSEMLGYSRNYCQQIVSFSQWWGKNVEKLQLHENRSDITAYMLMASAKCPKAAYQQAVKLLKSGESLSAKAMKQLVSDATPKKVDEDSPYDEEGLCVCLGCDQKFDKRGFHDPKAPTHCHECYKRTELEFAQEDADKLAASQEDSLEGVCEPVEATAVDILALFTQASLEQREEFVDQLTRDGHLELPNDDVNPYEEVLHWWGVCDDKQRKALAKKVNWQEYLPKASGNAKVKKTSTRFQPPTVEQVQAHCDEKGYTFDAEAFVAHYEANGWKVGRNKMKSWQSACVTWSKRDEKENGSKFVPPSVDQVAGYMEEMGINGFSATTFVDHYDSVDWQRGRAKMKDWKAAVRAWHTRQQEETAETEPGMYES